MNAGKLLKFAHPPPPEHAATNPRRMNANLSGARVRPIRVLTAAELHGFNPIVANARNMGWLTAHQTLGAARLDSFIVVRELAANVIRERRYDDGARWPYQLLHELSQGWWKVQPSASC